MKSCAMTVTEMRMEIIVNMKAPALQVFKKVHGHFSLTRDTCRAVRRCNACGKSHRPIIYLCQLVHPYLDGTEIHSVPNIAV